MKKIRFEISGLLILMCLAFLSIALAAAVLPSGCATAPAIAQSGKFYHIGLVWLKQPGNSEQRQKMVEAGTCVRT